METIAATVVRIGRSRAEGGRRTQFCCIKVGRDHQQERFQGAYTRTEGDGRQETIYNHKKKCYEKVAQVKLV